MLIAKRCFKIRCGTGNIEVPIRIFIPEEVDGAWQCRYEIIWPSDAKVSAAHGLDAVQAILLALQKIGIEIYASEYHESGRLVWIEQGQGYGFPVSRNVRNLLIGADADL